MPTTIDTLVTKYVLDDQYSKKTQNVTNATKDMDGAATGAGKALSGLQSGFGSLGLILDTVLAPVKIAATALGILGGAFVAATIYASKQAAELETLRLGLEAYAGSAEEAAKQMQRLRMVAAMPGLGFAESVAGSVRLQAAGFDSRLAERALLGFGNALALVGRGREDLDGVLLALGQIASKGKVSAEEINQIAERVPQIRELMKAAFKTSNSEDIQKMGITAEAFIMGIIDALEKLPKAAGGITNSFENLGDSFFQMAASYGTAINTALKPAIDTISSFIDYATSDSVFKDIGESIASFLGGEDGMKSGVINVLSHIMAIATSLPELFERTGAIIQAIGKDIAAFVSQLIDRYNAVVASGGWVIGLSKIDNDSRFGKNFNELGAAGGLYNWWKDSVEANVPQIASGFAGYQAMKEDEDKKGLGGGKGGMKGGGGPSPQLAQQTEYLRQIAQNTRKDLGEAFGYNIDATQLSDMRHRPPGMSRGMALIIRGLEMLGMDNSRQNQEIAAGAQRRKKAYGF